MTNAAGTVNAIEAVGPVIPSMLPDPQQLEMLRGPDGTLSRQAINQARGRGRPKNARNKRSKKVADYFVSKYGDPLDVLGQIMTMPTKALVEVLLEADGGQERADRLEEMVCEAIDVVKSLKPALQIAGGEVGRELAENIADAIEKLAKAAQAISGKPGKLALDALTLQLQSTFRALEYVHGKQPISVDFTGKADLVVFAPEILRQHGIDPDELRNSVATRGLEAIDPDTLRLVDHVTDGEFTQVDGPEGEIE